MGLGSGLCTLGHQKALLEGCQYNTFPTCDIMRVATSKLQNAVDILFAPDATKQARQSGSSEEKG